MANFEGINSSSRGISVAEIKNSSDAYRNNNNDDNDGHDFDTDDEDELSRISMTSSEKKVIAIPPNNITVENSLSEVLMQLSLNDRTAIEEEIHGVASDTEETPELLAWCLHKFDKELTIVKNSIRRHRKLERSHRMRNDDDDTPGNYDDEDVLRNVIRTTPDHVEEVGTERNDSTMETVTPIHVSAVSDSTRMTGIATGAEDGSKSSCYVNDPEVRLRFLRAERYDSKNAVKRFVNFLEFAQELYGTFVADRPIRLSDFKTREEKRALANSSNQFLPFRDRSGRRVFVSVGTCGYDITPRLRYKVLWYMYWIVSEDIESQRKGMIVVGWPSDNMNTNTNTSDDDTKSSESDGGGSTGSEYNRWEQTLRPNIANLFVNYIAKSFKGMPMRIAAMHICFQDQPIYRILNSMVYFAVTNYAKARFKIHIGEPLEIRYKLQGFGIPVDLLPLTYTLALKRQNHLQWIAFRKFIEHQQGGNLNGNGSSKCKKNPSKSLTIDPSDLVECPRSYDVIIGKTKNTNNPGNMFYRSLIEATHDEHIPSSKGDKVELTWRIVRQMEEQNGRFLEWSKSPKAWVRIRDRNIMRQKVARSYKEYKLNACVIQSKRHSKQLCNSPISSVKRQKTGCLSAFGCDENDDFNVSKPIFTTM